jgi:hypothetical protein
MKNGILTAALLFFLCFTGWTQDDDSSKVTLDLLRAPSSPASNLLGFAPSAIEKPTDVSAFMLSLHSATGSLTRLPANYAVDIAPFWLLAKKRDYTTASLNSKNKGDIFRQTFVLSTGIRSPDSLDKNLKASNTYAGLGFKFSLLRGHYDEATQNALNRIGLLQQKINATTLEELESLRETDPEMVTLLARKDSLVKNLIRVGLSMDDIKKTKAYVENQQAIDSLTEAWKERLQSRESVKAYFDELKQIASGFVLSREGWSWDFAGGFSGEFVNKQFDNSRLFNAGVWTTFGYTGRKGSSFLGLVRYLYNPSELVALTSTTEMREKVSTFDAGARYIYSNLESRFNGSIEAVYRSVLSSQTIDPSWRLAMNVEYSIWKNQKLTFTFGRDFNGTITKDGTLIATLNFLTGFGNKR